MEYNSCSLSSPRARQVPHRSRCHAGFRHGLLECADPAVTRPMPSDASRDRPQSGTGTGGETSGRLPHWLRDPLVVFVLLGIGVFALDGWLAGSEAARPVIEITPDAVDRLRARWIAQWGREPTEPELQRLVDEANDEEILYREAQRLGLDPQRRHRAAAARPEADVHPGGRRRHGPAVGSGARGLLLRACRAVPETGTHDVRSCVPVG